MKKTLPALLGVLASLGNSAFAVDKPAPNIIFILADDQGWGDLSSPMDPAVPESSSTYFSTPNMDRLAADGMRFPNGYAPAPICTPTRRSIQFGMTPARQRGTDFISDTFTPKGHLSIPQALKQANPRYSCAHFGKWGEVMSGTWKKNPQIAGYDESDPDSEANPSAMGYDESDGLTGNGTGTFYHPGYRPKDAYRNNICEPDPDPKRTFSVTGRAISFMERQVQEKRPFYLQVSYYAIHDALQARQETIDKYANKGPIPRVMYAGIAPMLEDMDDGIGQLVAAIDKLGIRDNTYIFISSDNGGANAVRPAVDPEKKLPTRNYPLRQHKQWVYEGGIRVPFIARGPGIKAGTVCREPVVQYDLLPTFYALAGGTVPLSEEIDGGNLIPLLHNEGKGAVKRSLPGLVFHRPKLKELSHSALRMGDYKLVISWAVPQSTNDFWSVEKYELFNLATDIGEKNNLAEQMPQKVNEMSAVLINYLKSVNAETAPIPKALSQPKK